ncbi:PAS domain S-box protein [Ferruginibacter lapsinanis]|uniref:hybrid sensor histidine kinase/response regulator n=1 Tax=Ferruginibacter lapsinanis TaxID=563172 RepID=UPI001E3A6E56|nr:PAS domain S-box protein [Ferruginibacter lapsinanis]UEG51233.1 PAS domain S-box protein [Ferruginibacter lapsinanis]
MNRKLKILHLEDLDSDAELVERELKKGNILFDKLVVDTRDDFENALAQFSPDIILSDHSLPSFNSIQALKIVKRAGLNIPFILITATVSEEFAVSVMQEGADDYILKDKMGRLPSAIAHVMEKYESNLAKKQAEARLLAAHERLMFHLENSPLGYIEWDDALNVKTWSKRTQEIFGWTKEEFNQIPKNKHSHVYVEDREKVYAIAEKLANGTLERDNTLNRNYTKDGNVIWCEWFNSTLKNENGKVVTIMSLVQDVTERKKAEEALVEKELRFREFFETAPEAILVVDPATARFVDYNDNALRLLKCSGEALLKKGPRDITAPFQSQGDGLDERIKEYIIRTMQGERPIFDWIIRDFEGNDIFCEIRLNVIANAGNPMIRASVLDITERVQLERKLLEEKIKNQKEITEAIITAQEFERSFLGEELHDNINQILATSKLYMDVSINSDILRKDLMTSSRNYLADAMEEIRKLSKSLQPPSLGETSLQSAVNEMLGNIKQLNKLDIIYEWENVDEKTLNEKIKLAVFRIIQEQLNNISKHAQAKKASIQLKQMNTRLILIIKDDGVGFDTSAKRKGIGLKNISNRASLFNGEVTIVSAPGAGCVLTVKFSI